MLYCRPLDHTNTGSAATSRVCSNDTKKCQSFGVLWLALTTETKCQSCMILLDVSDDVDMLYNLYTMQLVCSCAAYCCFTTYNLSQSVPQEQLPLSCTTHGTWMTSNRHLHQWHLKCRYLLYHPKKLTWNLKMVIAKKESSPLGHPFWGYTSMLVFGLYQFNIKSSSHNRIVWAADVDSPSQQQEMFVDLSTQNSKKNSPKLNVNVSDSAGAYRLRSMPCLFESHCSLHSQRSSDHKHIEPRRMPKGANQLKHRWSWGMLCC